MLQIRQTYHMTQALRMQAQRATSLTATALILAPFPSQPRPSHSFQHLPLLMAFGSLANNCWFSVRSRPEAGDLTGSAKNKRTRSSYRGFQHETNSKTGNRIDGCRLGRGGPYQTLVSACGGGRA